MKKIFYLQWAVAIVVFMGLPLAARYDSPLIDLIILLGIALSILLAFVKRRMDRE